MEAPQASSTTFGQEGAAPTVRVAILLGHAGEAGASYGVTGVERVVQRLLEGCAPKGIEPYLVYPKTGTSGRRLRDALPCHAAIGNRHDVLIEISCASSLCSCRNMRLMSCYRSAFGRISMQRLSVAN